MTETHKNPLTENLRIPGETFRLPSGGLFYKNGELDDEVQNGEVHVFPMTAIDEIIIKTPDKLFSGDAIKEVFGRCIPQIKKPMELFSRDVDYLLVCLRLISYGPTISVKWKHDCETAKEHEYTIELKYFINSSKSIDPTTIETDYLVQMENGQKVYLCPTRFKDIVKLYQSTDKDATTDFEKLKEILITNLTGMIDNVDGYTDKAHIAGWLQKIPVRWTYKIADAVEKVSDWGPKFVTKVRCKDCNEEIELSTPLNPIAFFI